MREQVATAIPTVSPSLRRALTSSHAVPHGNTAWQRPAWGSSPCHPQVARCCHPLDPLGRQCWSETPAERSGGRRARPAPCTEQ